MRRREFSESTAAVGQEYAEMLDVREYLRDYGYLQDTTPDDLTLDPVTSDAIKIFQTMANVPQTGVLDTATIVALRMPRCGVPDVPRGFRITANLAYVPIGCSYWGARALTYAFRNSTPDLGGDEERNAVRRALATWAAVIPFEFIEVPDLNNASLSFSWHAGEHGDGYAFDGPSGVLAHAFYPPPCGGMHAGSCHFDEAETWALTHGANQIDLETVALHEIGHLLGLAHSNVPGAVMYWAYSATRRVLTADDLTGIQSIYGKPGAAMRVKAHLEGYGDVAGRDSQFVGTRGESRRLEGIQLEIATPIAGVAIRYMVHLEGYGDTHWATEGEFLGTRRESRRLEGIAIRLEGSSAASYTVEYFAHLQGVGDTAIARDGEFCGTRGQSRRMEGVLVRIQAR